VCGGHAGEDSEAELKLAGKERQGEGVSGAEERGNEKNGGAAEKESARAGQRGGHVCPAEVEAAQEEDECNSASDEAQCL
jgi:hypothetical protein